MLAYFEGRRIGVGLSVTLFLLGFRVEFVESRGVSVPPNFVKNFISRKPRLLGNSASARREVECKASRSWGMESLFR